MHRQSLRDQELIEDNEHVYSHTAVTGSIPQARTTVFRRESAAAQDQADTVAAHCPPGGHPASGNRLLLAVVWVRRVVSRILVP